MQFEYRALVSSLSHTPQLMHIGNILSLAFNLGCAYSPNIGTLIGLRFLCKNRYLSN